MINRLDNNKKSKKMTSMHIIIIITVNYKYNKKNRLINIKNIHKKK
jgi:hypothetical protein